MIIYKITNLKTGKCYVGQTVQTFQSRKARHISEANGKNRYVISRAIRKYGVDSFSFEIIDWATNYTKLNYKEWIWIHKCNSLTPNGYNLKEGGSNAPINKEHRDAIGKSNSRRI